MLSLDPLERAVVAVVRTYRIGLGHGPTHVEIAHATGQHPSAVDRVVGTLLELRVLELDADGLDVAEGLGRETLPGGGGR